MNNKYWLASRAWRDGFDAAAEGLGNDKNPYPKDVRDYTQWDDGWHEGSSEPRRKRS